MLLKMKYSCYLRYMPTHLFRFSFLLMLLLLVGCRCSDGPIPVQELSSSITTQKLQQYGREALRFIEHKGYSKDFCILIDFSIPSGKNRFFVYDPVNHVVLDKGLTSHGTCTGPGLPVHETGAKYSNAVDSHCSSLGKYKIGERGPSSWGIGVKYWLHGLERGNNNAMRRAVVLHSWSVIPDFETYPVPIARSWGCPAVSDDFMQRLDTRLQSSARPVLMWIFN
jgi:hypothetical protein